MINFNDLPCDIKNVIFKINKDREKNEYINNKNQHLLVIDELQEYLDEGEELGHQAIVSSTQLLKKELKKQKKNGDKK